KNHAIFRLRTLKSCIGERAMGQHDPNGLSAIDHAIVARLQMDGRTPFSTMAAELSISEATAQRRTQQLLDDGFLKIIGVVDPMRAGRGHSVLIGINAEAPTIHTIPLRLAAIEEARFVAVV